MIAEFTKCRKRSRVFIVLKTPLLTRAELTRIEQSTGTTVPKCYVNKRRNGPYLSHQMQTGNQAQLVHNITRRQITIRQDCRERDNAVGCTKTLRRRTAHMKI